MRHRGELPLIKRLLCARYFTWHVITNHILSVMFTMTLQGMCYYSQYMGGETRWVAMSDSGSRNLFSKCMYVPDLFVTCHELIQSKPLWFLNNFYWSYLSGEKPPKRRFFTMQVLLPIPVAPFKKKQTASGVEIKLFATWPCMWTFSWVLEENSSRLVPYSDDSNLCFLCFKKELQYGSTGSGARTNPVMVEIG